MVVRIIGYDGGTYNRVRWWFVRYEGGMRDTMLE